MEKSRNVPFIKKTKKRGWINGRIFIFWLNYAFKTCMIIVISLLQFFYSGGMDSVYISMKFKAKASGLLFHARLWSSSLFFFPLKWNIAFDSSAQRHHWLPCTWPKWAMQSNRSTNRRHQQVRDFLRLLSAWHQHDWPQQIIFSYTHKLLKH